MSTRYTLTVEDVALLAREIGTGPSMMARAGFGNDLRTWFDSLPVVQKPSRRVVCLCGSSRFWHHYQLANYRETMAGRIVLTIGHYPHSPGQAHGESVGCTPEQKVELDRLHCEKIDLADEILVLDIGGYIGESTRREIGHAVATGKVIRYASAEWSEVDLSTQAVPAAEAKVK